MRLWTYADYEGPDQTAHLCSLLRASLSANRITDYYRMYEKRVDPDDTLRMLEDTFWLHVTHIMYVQYQINFYRLIWPFFDPFLLQILKLTQGRQYVVFSLARGLISHRRFRSSCIPYHLQEKRATYIKEI